MEAPQHSRLYVTAKAPVNIAVIKYWVSTVALLFLCEEPIRIFTYFTDYNANAANRASGMKS